MRNVGNRLIQALPVAERRSVFEDLRQTEIKAQDRLSLNRRSLPNVYFPTGAVISATYISKNAALEVRGVGREGMLGGAALRATEDARFELTCQIGGSMLYMPVATFQRDLDRHLGLQRVISLYSMSVLTFLTQSVACNGLHSIAQRCARSLLVISDRTGSREFPLTHELLARMLGVRRSGVSIAVHRFGRAGLIRYRHGRVSIIDRRHLLAESCECYRVALSETPAVLNRRR